MSRTLFLYIFKDLIRIFLMASAALAGIMSFGGLLRPLTREGLDAGQVARMLAYFGPAMTTYSFPVAALFATAVVYGRLAADNELTACKAGGISLLSLTVSGPALVLGLVVAIVSLLFLCFIVPASTLRVEKVIYSNLAKLVESRIERNHEIDFESTTVFAQEAHVIPPDPAMPNRQRVVLIGAEVIAIDHEGVDHTLLVPKEFYTASRAYIYIDPQPDGENMNVTVDLKDGFKFPRRYEGATMAGVQDLQYGPNQIPSPIKEDVKFMNIWRLKEVYADVSKSQRLKGIITELIKSGQLRTFDLEMSNDFNGPDRGVKFDFGKDGSYSIHIADPKDKDIDKGFFPGNILIPYPAPKRLPSSTQPVNRPLIFREEKPGSSPVIVRAAALKMRVTTDPEDGLFNVNAELHDCVQIVKGDDGITDIARPRENFDLPTFPVPMNRQARAMSGQNIAFYETMGTKEEQARLHHEKVGLINSIIAESNGRASFSISCLILVMAGSALGMMFRSGNFLTAFAVSFVPALISITLIIAGQRTAANVPLKVDAHNNPLVLGLVLIWTGNGVNLVLALGLLWKLGRR